MRILQLTLSIEGCEECLLLSRRKAFDEPLAALQEATRRFLLQDFTHLSVGESIVHKEKRLPAVKALVKISCSQWRTFYPFPPMAREAPADATALPVQPQKTTAQPWRTQSVRQGFNLPDQGIADGSIVSRLPTFTELKGAVESMCGQKFFVIEEKRTDKRTNRRDVPCATAGVLYIKDSPEHFHSETTELYLVLDVGEQGSQMVVGNEVVDLKPGMAILLPPGEANKHGGFGELQAFMLFSPGLAKKGNFAERDEIETGLMSRASAEKLQKKVIAGPESERTPGGTVVTQIPEQFLQDPPGEPIGDESIPFRRSIPGLSMTARTVRGDSPTLLVDDPLVTKVFLITGGKGQMLIGNKVQDVQKNDVVLVPAGVEHALLAAEGNAVNVVIATLSENTDLVQNGIDRAIRIDTRPHLAHLLSQHS